MIVIRGVITMTDNESKQTIPEEQYEHISSAMYHLGRIDDRELPSDVARYIEQTYVNFDDLYLRVDDDE